MTQIPFNQACRTYGLGPGGVFGDKCGAGFSGDTAEYIAVCAFVVFVCALCNFKRSPFAGVLLSMSIFRALWGTPTPSSFTLGLLLNSRAAVSWHTSVVSLLHVLFKPGEIGIAACCHATASAALVYVYNMAAWALAVTSVVLSGDATQPVQAYLAFDLVGVCISLFWLVKP